MTKPDNLYSENKWIKRHRHRSDISTYLTHLTKGNEENDVYEVLNQILKSQKLIGSNSEKSFVNGIHPVVCLQDIPTYGVSQNTLHEQFHREELGGKIRYLPFGLMFKKRYVFEKGGRPVFYEQGVKAKEILPKDEWWRIVSFDLSNPKSIIDWTHEREWRVKGDFSFELEQAILLLPMQHHYQEFIKRFGVDILGKLGGVVVMEAVLS